MGLQNPMAWWRHLMDTYSALLALCVGNSLATGEFPAQRPVTRSFEFFFDLRLNKRLSKQPWDWRFETPSRLLWRHCNEIAEQLQCWLSWWNWKSLMFNKSVYIPLTLYASCCASKINGYSVTAKQTVKCGTVILKMGYSSGYKNTE